MVELRIRERQAFRLPLAELDPVREIRTAREGAARPAQHVGALIDSDHGAPVALHQAPRDEPGAGRHVEHPVPGLCTDPSDHLPAPPRVLAEAEGG